MLRQEMICMLKYQHKLNKKERGVKKYVFKDKGMRK